MPQIKKSIDDVFQSGAVGSLDKAIGNNLIGINHMQTPSAVPSNKEQQGFQFIVRPQLNLQADNIRNDRKFMPLLANNDVSVHRYVRTMLDPRLMVGYKLGTKIDVPRIFSPLTNNNLAFIPVMTNNIQTSAGWPDPVVPTFTSKEGRYGEVFTMVDGLVQNFKPFDVDCTFRNTMMDPILYLTYIWINYMSNVFTGKFVPYPDFISDMRMDYTTRIFRIRLDRNRLKVTKIMSTGPAIPVASSVGQFGDMNMENTISESNKDISIRFQCNGFEIFDDILIKEFNQIVAMFQRQMDDDRRPATMINVPVSLRHMFQHRAYPRINPDSHILEWWVEREMFDARTQIFLDTLSQADLDTINQINGFELELEPEELGQ